jgi:hypothetical protein
LRRRRTKKEEEKRRKKERDPCVRGKERGKERKEKDKGHVAPCEWLGGDNKIHSSQLGKATWQG